MRPACWWDDKALRVFFRLWGDKCVFDSAYFAVVAIACAGHGWTADAGVHDTAAPAKSLYEIAATYAAFPLQFWRGLHFCRAALNRFWVWE